MRVLIIGTGWYGCHLASILNTNNINFVIVDKSNKIFEGSSSKNQNRLHLGFHYPRSIETIIESRYGYDKFLEKYSDLVYKFDKNFYFISSIDSHIEIERYLKIMKEHTTKFIEYSDELPIHITNIERPIICVEEQYINPFLAKNFFSERLKSSFKLIENSNAFNSIEEIIKELNTDFNLIINCTFNHLNPIPFDHYELYVTLLYKIENIDIFAYTIMDGPFFSIYPYDIDNKIYTVTSVNHGILYKGNVAKYDISENDIHTIRTKVEEQISFYISDWKNLAKYTGYFTSWKTKPNTITDDRSLRYKKEGNILNFYGGKITGIFEAENILLSILKEIKN